MIEIRLNATQVKLLTEAIVKQFPFATRKALNRLIIEAQRYQRFHQRRVFEVRQKKYFEQSVKIPPGGFATKTDPYEARMVIDPKGTTPKFDIWLRQEYGGTRKPVAGRKKLTIPPNEDSRLSKVGLTRTPRGLIPQRLRPRNLKRKFVIPFGSGKAGLFRRLSSRQKGYTKTKPGQRFGLRDDPNVELMYVLHESAEIEPVYDFYANARRTWSSKWARYLEEELEKAFSSARVRGVPRS